jgi:DNA-binding transcriptional MerR regulator
VLTISELASYAGVTVRAVRHYHAKGLLPEPQRDTSGYRRYDAGAVVDLIRIRTLAEAGVPLARVQQLLQADEEEFSAAVTDIDARLRAEIRQLQRHRQRIARLAAGDSLALPPEAVEYLNRLRELGIPEPMVDGERDAWIVIAAHSPEQMSELMAEKRRQMEDPELIELYRALAEAIDWAADDPRLPSLADRLVHHIEKSMPSDYPREGEFSTEVAGLIDSVFLDSVPVAGRLLELLEERGWSGWTEFKPVARPAAGE